MEPSEKYSVVLVEPLYQLNIGYVARSMLNFGFRRLVLVNPRTEIGSEAYVFSAHAKEVIKNSRIVGSFEEAISDASLVVGTTGKIPKRYSSLRVPIAPEDLAQRLFKFNGKVALVFGREDVGLKNKELEKCDVIVTIPTAPIYPILNLSHAVTIILYEIYKNEVYRKSKHVGAYKFVPPTSNELRILHTYFEEILDKINYPIARRRSALLAFKRVIGKAMPDKREVHALMSVLRKILVRLERVD
ncbi:MAG: RNA methyltransferase [Thermoprotei archaeon]|nr:MAG: RNA methyltransferase [Thermoprotei archaeon]RLE80077.1 MAG: RNA methyltransferase [Thermoprotei archaeon]RLF01819.1 MAG: RNA methyltransferase [Thermoprotei archaeon]